MAANKKPCNCHDKIEKGFIWYQVEPDKVMGVTHCAQENADKGITSYIQVVKEGDLSYAGSNVDNVIKVLNKYGLDKVTVMSGAPPCIPSPKRPCT